MEVAEGEFVRDYRLDGGEQARGIGVFNYRVVGEVSKEKTKIGKKKKKKGNVQRGLFIPGRGLNTGDTARGGLG